MGTNIAKTAQISLGLFRGQLHSLSVTGSFHEMTGYAVDTVTLSCVCIVAEVLASKLAQNGTFPPLSNKPYRKLSFQGPYWVFVASKKVV